MCKPGHACNAVGSCSPSAGSSSPFWRRRTWRQPPRPDSIRASSIPLSLARSESVAEGPAGQVGPMEPEGPVAPVGLVEQPQPQPQP
eukprot:7814297-Pyramimonas_sp.AAC.1